MDMVKPETKKTYPMLLFREGIWWALRKRFNQSIPPKVDGSYLSDVLGVEAASATKNLIPLLKKLGIIDEQSKPTQRARRWRNDEQYPSVCEEIRQEVYPSELLAAFPDPTHSLTSVEKWFLQNTDVGERAARYMAAFYLLLCRADATEQDNNNPSPKASAATKGKSQPRKISALRTKTTRKGTDSKLDTTQIADPAAKIASPPKHIHGFEPDLHINIQIHIASDTSTDQIDHIFASMAKHLSFLQKRDYE